MTIQVFRFDKPSQLKRFKADLKDAGKTIRGLFIKITDANDVHVGLSCKNLAKQSASNYALGSTKLQACFVFAVDSSIDKNLLYRLKSMLMAYLGGCSYSKYLKNTTSLESVWLSKNMSTLEALAQDFVNQHVFKKVDQSLILNTDDAYLTQGILYLFEESGNTGLNLKKQEELV